MKRAERLVDQSIDLDPLLQRPLPATERPLPRDTNLTHLRLARGGLDPLDKLAKLLLEVVEVSEQIGLNTTNKYPSSLSGSSAEPASSPNACTIKASPKPL